MNDGWRRVVGPILLLLLAALAACSPQAAQTVERAPVPAMSQKSQGSIQEVLFTPDTSGASAAVAAQTTDLEATLTSLYQRVNPAVVYIVVPPLGSGSGF